MPRISTDGPENELAMVAIKNEIPCIFYWSHLIFGNQNSAASSIVHGKTRGGGRVVPSLMVAENGATGFACTSFLIPAISPWQARSMDASHSGCEPQHWRKEGGAAGDGKQVSEGVVVGVVVGTVSGSADAHGWTCWTLFYMSM